MKTIVKTISRRGAEKGDKREVIGKISFVVPTVEEILPLSIETVTDEDGVVSYKNKVTQWVQEAIESAVAGELANRLQPQSTDWKPGYREWATFEEFLSQALESNRGAGVAAAAERRREWVKLWTSFVVGLKKSAGWTKAMTLIGSDLPTKGGKKVELQNVSDEKSRNRFGEVLADFYSSLSDQDADKFEQYFESFKTLLQAPPVEIPDLTEE
mgnify:CR=1 FL=1|jgi:hypothetical protein